MARFDRLTVYNTIVHDGMIPLFYNPDLEVAKQIVEALYDGGSRVLEFTNRGDFAIEVFGALVKHCVTAHPDMVIGIGTVDDAPTAALYIAYGANFIVSPTFNPDVARLCNRRKIAYMPGCGDLNDIAIAEESGVEIVKLFPGSTSGGPAFVKAVLAARPMSRIMPTGGVTPEEDNLRGWFDAGVVCVGMGSKLVRKDWIQAGDFEKVENGTHNALKLIQSIRTEK